MSAPVEMKNGERLTIFAVAEATGRSYSWVRARTIDGTFAYFVDGRRLYVDAQSLRSFLRSNPTHRRAKLRLVVDNTK